MFGHYPFKIKVSHKNRMQKAFPPRNSTSLADVSLFGHWLEYRQPLRPVDTTSIKMSPAYWLGLEDAVLFLNKGLSHFRTH